jgi:Ran GTPase-activating protein (RanGAP) involved in mRNA processing and transport
VDGSQLVSLNLGSNRLGRGGARAIAKALAVNQSLTKLSLANNAVMEYGAVQLASLIRNRTALKQLNLSMDKVGDRGAATLATALLDTPGALTILNLRNNFVGDGAAGEFAVLLRRRKILTELDLSCLSCNVIPDVGARGIVGAFRANTSLRVFACGNNRFTDPRVFRALEAALQLDTACDEKVKVGANVDHFLHDVEYVETQ